jgi:glycosyltransferase involved in cell wall biosynthesis
VELPKHIVSERAKTGVTISRMNLLHVIHRYPPAPGGAEKYAKELAKFLGTNGHSVTTWTSTADDLEAMRYAGFQEFPAGEQDGVNRFRPLHFLGRRYLCKALSMVGSPAWAARWMPSSPIMPSMWKAMKKYDDPLDAVHAFAFPYSYPIAVGRALAKRRNVPFLLTPFLHLGDPMNPRDHTRAQYTSRALRWLLQAADHVFVQTPSELEACRKLGVPASRLTLQGLGIDASECTGGNRDAARKRWQLLPQDFVIGHLANLSHEKGTVDLLEAVKHLPVKVLLAGPAMPKFERAWPKLQTANTQRLGVIDEATKRDFFQAIDVFVLPSRSDSFGLVLLEAWANAKPVIVYRAGGPADLVRHDVDGLQVACGDVSGLTQAIELLYADETKRSAMGMAGERRVLADFRRDERMRPLLEILHKLKG